MKRSRLEEQIAITIEGLALEIAQWIDSEIRHMTGKSFQYVDNSRDRSNSGPNMGNNDPKTGSEE